MVSIEHATTSMGLGLIITLAVAIAKAVLNGRVNTRGLLTHDGARRSGSRLIALVAAVAGSAMFLVDVLADPTPETMPEISGTALFLLAGANGVYIAGKARLAAIETLLRGKR